MAWENWFGVKGLRDMLGNGLRKRLGEKGENVLGKGVQMEQGNACDSKPLRRRPHTPGEAWE